MGTATPISEIKGSATPYANNKWAACSNTKLIRFLIIRSEKKFNLGFFPSQQHLGSLPAAQQDFQRVEWQHLQAHRPPQAQL